MEIDDSLRLAYPAFHDIGRFYLSVLMQKLRIER
jgi:hypothetical protein